MLEQDQFKGTWTALVTPFSADSSEIDLNSLRSLLEFQISAKVDGVVVCGSTGEAQTLSDEEYKQVVAESLSVINGRVPCIAGIGASSTDKACAISHFLKGAGVGGILLVAPPYNKPPQRGISEHFRHVKQASHLPIIAYNIPGRTGINILPKTLANLASEGVISAVKESSASLDQVMDILAAAPELPVLSGEDSMVNAIMACGGRGVISASANLLPEEFVEISSNALQGDFKKAAQAQLKILPIIRALFMETNPIPVKAALALKGIIRHPAVRLPLVNAEHTTMNHLKGLLHL